MNKKKEREDEISHVKNIFDFMDMSFIILYIICTYIALENFKSLETEKIKI